MEDGQEIGAYLFRRTVPSIHLTPDDVRWMVRIVPKCEAFTVYYVKHPTWVYYLSDRIDALCP